MSYRLSITNRITSHDKWISIIDRETYPLIDKEISRWDQTAAVLVTICLSDNRLPYKAK